MPEWKHKARYGDVQALRRHGWWPDKTVPAWAEERAAHYQTSPTAAVVLESAYVEEIERLEELLSKFRRAYDYMETALKYIVRDCVQCPDTAQYADRILDGLKNFGEEFRKPPIVVHLRDSMSDPNRCFRDIFNTLERFVDEKTLEEMSWYVSRQDSTLIDVSPLLQDHDKIYDAIRLVVSYWDEKDGRVDTIR